jgi:hypothetical protein
MIKLPGDFLFGKITNMLARVYLVPIQKFISPCLPTGNEENEIDYFKSALKFLIEDIKKNTKDKYEKFKTHLERPVLIRNTIITLNKLFIEHSGKKDVELIDEDELFLSIVIYVSEILWTNSFLFVFSGLSDVDKNKRKLKISILIRKSIHEAIEDTFMQLYINESYNDRINELKKILINDKNKTIKYSEQKVLSLIDELGGQGLFINNELRDNYKIKREEKPEKIIKKEEKIIKKEEKPKKVNVIEDDPFERRQKLMK